ncbi:hypothetical protein LPTSP2_20510 [Leptospira ellinghausenii]|uniref:Uncharacterized protein n=1 Tax=Leptospira ellinghausenii TaxID=1917822 RepID=A0A2P2DDR2_9LEPT|nr:hypothetical protein LPTSP2_20510 [Leptospira ellinghausenii]
MKDEVEIFTTLLITMEQGTTTQGMVILNQEEVLVFTLLTIVAVIIPNMVPLIATIT